MHTTLAIVLASLIILPFAAIVIVDTIRDWRENDADLCVGS